MKVIVTGGSGFIGRYLVRELEENGYDVFILSRKMKGENVRYGDVRNIESIKKAFRGMDAVFHNAAYAMDWGRKRDFYETNVVGTDNVAKSCIENGIERLIYTSSAGVYGFPNSLQAVKEDSPKKPLNAYQKSKLLGEIILQRYDMHVSIIRPPLVLGAGARAAEILMTSIKNGNFFYIGNGNSIISIAHPFDVAKCLRLAFERDKEGTSFNVVSFSCSVREMAEKIADLLGVEKPRKRIAYPVAYAFSVFNEFFSYIFNKEPKLTRFRVKSLGTDRMISWKKARILLGYQPEFDMEKTVEDMVRWFMNQ